MQAVARLKTMVKYVVADGYFMKHDFITPLVKEGLHVITKMLPDADLRYIYNGARQRERVRPKMYDGKVDCKRIDKRRIGMFEQDEQVIYHSGIVQ